MLFSKLAALLLLGSVLDSPSDRLLLSSRDDLFALREDLRPSCAVVSVDVQLPFKSSGSTFVADFTSRPVV